MITIIVISIIVILIIVILIIAYFIGVAVAEDDDTLSEKRKSPNRKPTKSKQVFKVVKIDNPQLKLPEVGSIPDSKNRVIYR